MPWFLNMIEQPNGERCKQLFIDNFDLFSAARGSAHNHQTWEGGYLDHLQETMNCAALFYEPLNRKRPQPYTLADVVLVLFLHDLEKPWKYHRDDSGTVRVRPEFEDRDAVHRFKLDLIKRYWIELTPDQQNAFDFIEGEIGNYSPYGRGMGKLAAFCHICDISSARLMPDHPLEGPDPWPDCDEWKLRRR